MKQFGLEKDDHPAAYAPYSQLKFPWLRWMNFVVRSDRDAANLVAPMRSIIRSLDPGLPVFEVSTLEHRLQVSLAPRWFLLVLMAALSGLALLLGLVGTYGVVSYLMLQRRAEFAIRIALGATNRDLVRLVLSRGVLLTGWGLLAGLAASVALSRYVQHLLFGECERSGGDGVRRRRGPARGIAGVYRPGAKSHGHRSRACGCCDGVRRFVLASSSQGGRE